MEFTPFVSRQTLAISLESVQDVRRSRSRRRQICSRTTAWTWKVGAGGEWESPLAAAGHTGRLRTGEGSRPCSPASSSAVLELWAVEP